MNTQLGYEEPPRRPAVETILIEKRDQPQRLTTRREVDARTALTRGLADYISQLEIQWAQGRLLRFYNVFDEWPESEQDALYPSALVNAVEVGTYSAARLTPEVGTEIPDVPGTYIVSPSELELSMTIELFAADPEARAGLVAMLEDGLSPVVWRYGILLELPFYLGQRASYELLSVVYEDNADDSQQRIRKATLVVKGQVCVSRLQHFPKASPRVRVQAT